MLVFDKKVTFATSCNRNSSPYILRCGQFPYSGKIETVKVHKIFELEGTLRSYIKIKSCHVRDKETYLCIIYMIYTYMICILCVYAYT